MVAKPKKNLISFELTPKNLLNLLRFSIEHPRQYTQALPLDGNFKAPIIFVITIYITSSLLKLLIDLITQQNPSVLFLGISGIVFALPLVILTKFIQAGVFYLLSKALKGQGSFKATFRASSYSAIPTILSFLPIISFISTLWEIILTTLALKRAHQFSYNRAIITVVTPFLIVVIVLIMLGLLAVNNLNLFPTV